MQLMLAGCGGNIRNRIEKGIERCLPQIIGPASSYQVTVSGSTLKMFRHRLSRVYIKGEDVRLPNGLEVSHLDVCLNEVEFDPDKRTIIDSAEATYSVVLSEEELERYLKKTYPSIPGLGIDLKEGHMVARASPSLIGLTTTISAAALFGIDSQRKLVLDIKKINAVGVQAPSFAREYIESKLNPVFDASELGYDATIDSVSIKPGYVTITGKLDLAKDAKRTNGT